MGPAIEILADFGGNACDPGNWSAIAGQSINNQLAIMLIKTTATAPLKLGGLGGRGGGGVGVGDGLASALLLVYVKYLHRFHDAIDLTDKTDRTKQG